MNMPAKPATQVVIVGGGPVGLGLAIDLGQRGVSCVLVERYVSPQPIPKGQNLTQRTLEHFYFWGAEAELRAARTIPPNYGIGGMTSYGTLLSGYRYDWLQRELVRPYYFTDNERLPQYATEAVLRHRLSQLPNVETIYGWSAAGIAQDAEGVQVTIAERNSDRQRVLRADYVVGCDGSRSLVREAAGIPQTLTDHDRLMVLLVFRSTGLHKLLERFPNKSFYNVLHPDLKGYWKFFGRVDLGTTWFFHAPVPLGTTKDNFDFRGLLHEAVGDEFDVAFEHIGFWDLRIAIADQYRIGRVFIAGDAAHSHPPYGGYGINTGLEDAANLGWKLAAALQGWAGPRLLDTYGEERRPVFASTAQDFIEKAIQSDRNFLGNVRSRDRQGCVRSRMAGALVRCAFGSEFVRAELRGLIDRRRPAWRRLQCNRVASIRGARRPSSVAAPACVGPQCLRGTGRRVYAARFWRAGSRHRLDQARRRDQRRTAEAGQRRQRGSAGILRGGACAGPARSVCRLGFGRRRDRRRRHHPSRGRRPSLTDHAISVVEQEQAEGRQGNTRRKM